MRCVVDSCITVDNPLCLKPKMHLSLLSLEISLAPCDSNLFWNVRFALR
jgi:hypothetical protein